MAVNMKKYRFVGLDKDVWLPDDIAVEIKIIDHPRFRSYTRDTQQIYTVYHDTGNPNTNARGEYAWAAGGRQGGSVGGYNFIFDDSVIIQAAPLNEVTWAQGVSWGNVQGWASEHAWGGSVNWERSLYVGAALHGGLIAAMGWDADKNLKQHNFFTGKDCPGQLRRRGQWPKMVQMVKDAAAKARAAAGGTVEENNQYAKPVPIPELARWVGEPLDTIPSIVRASGVDFVFVGDVVEATQDTPRYQYAHVGSGVLNENIKKGEQFVVSFIFFTEGEWWYYSPWDTRILVKHTRRVKDVPLGG